MQLDKLIPGKIKLALTYFGDENEIQIPLTFKDPINDRNDLYNEIKQYIVPEINPHRRANLTVAMDETFQLFNDLDDSGNDYCMSKTVYFITNGHVQCGPCVCNSIVCPNFNETDFECWENTNKITLAEIGHLKQENSDVNMILSTPNNVDCLKMERPADETESRNNPEMKSWWERYDAKNTEDCYNDTNVRMLANWRYDQLKDDPNLNCGRNQWNYNSHTKYPYDEGTSEELCKMSRGKIDQGLKPAADLPANLRGVKRLNDRDLNNNILDYFNMLSRSCFDNQLKEVKTECHGDISWPYPKNDAVGGNKGCDGPRGPDGERGRPGRQGAGGNPGAQGPDGAQGLPGRRGPAGDDGDKPISRQQIGSKGNQGEKGPIGQPGSPGNFGPKGKPGKVGPSGVSGVPGPQGPPGCYGPSGQRGEKGGIGAQGPKGPQGPPGQAGDGMDEEYLEEYKKILRSLIYDEINGYGGSDLLKLISEKIKSEYGVVCAKSSQCRPAPVRNYPTDEINPQCRAPIAVPYMRSRYQADAPEFRRTSFPYLDTCQCDNPTQAPPIAVPYEPIIVRRPETQKQVVLDLDETFNFRPAPRSLPAKITKRKRQP